MARLPYLPTSIPGPGSINIFRLLANAPTLFPLLAAQGQTQYTSLSLSTRLRELVIFYSSLRFESAYEYLQHVEISKGYVTDEQRAEIERAGRDGGHFMEGRAREESFSEGEVKVMVFLEGVVNSRGWGGRFGRGLGRCWGRGGVGGGDFAGECISIYLATVMVWEANNECSGILLPVGEGDDGV